TDEELAEHFSLLTAFLSRHLGIPVRVQVADDYRSLIQLIEAGKVQVAWLGTALLETWDKKDMVEILCHPIQRGRAHYRSAILVRQDSPFRTLTDLAGHRMAYVDRFSGSGFLYPARLFREQGLDPVASFSETLFSGNHSRSLEALLSGTTDAAAIFIDSGDESGIPTGTRCLSWVQWIPTDPIVVRRDLATDTRQRLKQLFINIGQYPGGLETMQHLKARRGYEGFLADEELKN
ncbi:MAG TPA: phosphate/phosphite/phosphonate ABC transporter substrate-binding protein, partial [Candidatus Ozemobacteraceae bacterium]|nr:phosphate/phosphite/phosphonate ABC transporter substrate-binding protein [Candidatus Ozemobacteraceae bacterium]